MRGKFYRRYFVVSNLIKQTTTNMATQFQSKSELINNKWTKEAIELDLNDRTTGRILEEWGTFGTLTQHPKYDASGWILEVNMGWNTASVVLVKTRGKNKYRIAYVFWSGHESI